MSDKNGVSPTEFLSSNTSPALLKKLDEIRSPDIDKSNQVNSMIENWTEGVEIFRPNSGNVVFTTSDAVHRRGRATQSGWRYFLRIDFYPP